MPYITTNARKVFDPEINTFNPIETEGELNYVITRLCHRYLTRNGKMGYADINAAVGALECAKLEIYRRIAAQYEDEKIKINGDVLP